MVIGSKRKEKEDIEHNVSIALPCVIALPRERTSTLRRRIERDAVEMKKASAGNQHRAGPNLPNADNGIVHNLRDSN
jgi:hypothetical protein